MKTGINGFNLIKEFEGLRLHTYKCPADRWTIGYGHTADVSANDVITEAQAISLLYQDVAESERAVNKYVHVPLTQNQFDALVSFVFNLGVGSFRTSTLLKNSIPVIMTTRPRNLGVGSMPAAKRCLAWYADERPNEHSF